MTRFRQVAFLAALLFAALALVPLSAHAQETARQRYGDCMDLVQTRPGQAFDDATRWESLGGGLPARHCALAALMELGHAFEAAQGLEKLAERVPRDGAFKARLLVQASHAWLAADNAQRAAQVADAALDLTPDAPDADIIPALLARARARAGLDAFWDAADDLSRVLYVRPDHAEALVLRGAAYRQLQAFDLARDDLDRALALAPDHPEGLLERGIVKRLMNNKTGARADWRALIAAHPDTPAARDALDNLHILDSGLD